MRIFSTKTHGVLDYLTGAALLAAPKALGLEDVPSSSRALKLAGGGATAYSLLTDYELGVAKVLPMPVYLALDAASGVLLASSPWLFGFAKNGTRYWLPHVLVGAQEILPAATTRTR